MNKLLLSLATIQDLYFDPTGNLYGILGLGADPNVRNNLAFAA